MRIFVTGASGWIGSAVVPELVGAGHQVVGLARSDASAAALPPPGPRCSAAPSTISTSWPGRLTGRTGSSTWPSSTTWPSRATSKVQPPPTAGPWRRSARRSPAPTGPSSSPPDCSGLPPGRVATEQDGLDDSTGTTLLANGPEMRRATAHLTASFASAGVRSSVLRLPPTVHGDGDNGFMATIVGIARATGTSGYLGDGTNRWPAVHRSDAARLFRLAVEQAPAGSTLHVVGEEGVPIRAVADVIGRRLDLPVVAVAPEDADAHFSFLAHFLGLDSPASSEWTRKTLGWRPTGPGLLDDLGHDYYFRQAPAA